MDPEELARQQAQIAMLQARLDELERQYIRMLETSPTRMLIVPPADDAPSQESLTYERLMEAAEIVNSAPEPSRVFPRIPLAQELLEDQVFTPIAFTDLSESIPAWWQARPIINASAIESPSMRTFDLLRQGDGGEQVLEVQRLLRSNGFDVQTSGSFTDATRIAVIDFQRQQNIVADGIVGPVTLARLRRNGNYDIENGSDEVLTRALLRGASIFKEEAAKEEVLPPEPFSISEFFRDKS